MVFSYSSVFYDRKLMNGFGYLSMIIIFSISVLLTTQTASAQVEILIDCDGTTTALDDCPNSQEVTPGDPLTPWPTLIPCGFPPPHPDNCTNPSAPGFNVPIAGIDWFDRDNSRTWTLGDDLHSEHFDTCSTIPFGNIGFRNGFHDTNIDCAILDIDSNLGSFIHPGSGFSGDIVDCDLETGGSPAGGGSATPPFGFPPPPPPCQDTRINVQLTFFDSNGDMFWNDGEDIVLDINGNGIFDPPTAVGGKLIQVDKTALVLASTQFTSSWVIPTLVAAIGFGLVISRKI